MKLGDKVWLLPVGNEAIRINFDNKKSVEEFENEFENFVKEAEVVKIGRKLVTAIIVGRTKEIQFYLEQTSIEGHRQKTDGCVDWLLYEDRQTIIENREKELLLSYIRKAIGQYGSSPIDLQSLRKIKSILCNNF